jgi:Fe-S cluster biogenesis protein NfuA
MNDAVLERIERALERIRPALQLDGGDISLVEWRDADRTVRVALEGACAGCHNTSMTMVLGVERVLKQLVPEVANVEAV